MSAKPELNLSVEDDWRPVRTAIPYIPLMVWNGDWGKGWFAPGIGWMNETGMLEDVTHWMPLPLPPVNAGRAA